MKSYLSRSYKKYVGGIFRQMKPYVWVFNIVSFVLIVNCFSFRRFSLVRMLIGVGAGIVFTVLWALIGALIIAKKNEKLYSVLDEYGYSVEYLRAYESERILGKPFRLQYAAEYAEIFVNIGQPADALKYLNSIIIPPNAPINEKISFFVVYVVAALKTGNVQLAESVWSNWQGVLNSARNEPSYASVSYMIYLSLILIDCCAGRVQRAYDQTVSYMNSPLYKRYPLPNPNFDILMLYELNALGRTDEAAALYPSVKSKIDKFDPLFAALKEKTVREFNKAARGEIPL